MVIDYYRFYFPHGKFKLDTGHKMVRDLAVDFNFGRHLYAKKEKRRRLLRLV